MFVETTLQTNLLFIIQVFECYNAVDDCYSVGKFCGSQQPSVIESRYGGILKAHFHTNAMVNGGGFNVSYTAIGKNSNRFNS